MVFNRNQATTATMQNLNLGYPAFMVQGYIEKIIQHLYQSGYGIAMAPLESGYQIIAGNEAVGLIVSAASAVGLNPKGHEHKIASGVATMNGKGYMFVRRVA